ncbi:hypothetical protein N7468_005235 [Penicillium chermesinum]|uniref:DUF7587 domain-containing protein n=1 Tax=Penicillium chermesinum TaxID=63820 RepID=A0A9W9NYS2_9EURO|nr:uncharacterized protein N7468_005235 [Penicillium chermesinum]KAJ5232279.1 hypothetical protein N7468_005235 [Penicillium chermesinum]
MPTSTCVSWNTPMRQILCCLHRFFDLTKDDMVTLLSEIFGDHLEHNLTKAAMCTQWSWMRASIHGVWWHVCIEEDFEKDGIWAAHIEVIRKSAQRLAIEATERKRDNMSYPPATDQVGTPKFAEEFLESVLWVSGLPGLFEIMPLEPHGSSSGTQSPTSSHDMASPSTSALHLPVKYRSESLVTGHQKVCLWCSIEGHLHDWQEDTTDTTDQLVPTDDSMLVDENNPGGAPRPADQVILQSIESNDEMIVEEDGFGSPQDPCLSTSLASLPIVDEEDHGHAADIEIATRDGLETHVEPLAPVASLPRKILPRVLFRWSNAKSQGTNLKNELRAGMFMQLEPFSHTAISEESFLEHFKTHVSKVKKATPFISFSRHLLVPIHRCLRKGKAAKFSIIDTSKLDTLVFEAHDLVDITGTRTARWSGRGEYLVWGCVPKQAIACTIQLARLEKIARGHDDISDFLQLDTIRGTKRCDERLYSKLAEGQVAKNHSTTVDRLMMLLDMPREIRDEVKSLIIEQWAKWRWKHSEKHEINRTYDFVPFNQVDISSSDGEVVDHIMPESSTQQSHKSPSYCPSRTDLTSSESSEEEDGGGGEVDDEMASREGSNRRRDTPSEGYSVHDSSNDELDVLPSEWESLLSSESLEALERIRLRNEVMHQQQGEKDGMVRNVMHGRGC